MRFEVESNQIQVKSSAGCPEHTYTQSVRQCAQCAQSVLMTHSVHTFFGSLHLVYAFVEPKTLCANFFWAAGNFLHTFCVQDRTSCTLFKAVFRNLCVLALHPVHTVRPPAGCPVPPGTPSARPAWIKLCGLCLFILASGPARMRTACGGRTPAGRAGAERCSHIRGPLQAERTPSPFHTERLLLSCR